MKKILIFSLAYFPHVGGAEVALKEITDRISPSDIEFHMVTLRFDSGQAMEEKIGNVFVHRVGKSSNYLSKILFIPRAARAAKKLHKQYQFDALWAMMTYMIFSVVLARLLGLRLPYVVTLQDGDTFRHVFKRWYIRPLSPLLHLGFRRATVVQAISTFLGKWARCMQFMGPLEIIPNGVDTQAFARALPAGKLNTLKERLGKQKGDIFLITTSRLVHKNAVDDIIRALPRLSPNIKLLILGIGPCEQMLKQLAAKLGVPSRVQFLGYIEHAELPAYLHISDIFIRPSRSEGMGISFIEAFAAGLPVVATQEGGISDFLFDAKKNPNKAPTGFAVDKNSPEQIAEAVQTILTNPAPVKLVIQNAHALALEKYDWDLIANDMREKVFARVLD